MYRFIADFRWDEVNSNCDHTTTVQEIHVAQVFEQSLIDCIACEQQIFKISPKIESKHLKNFLCKNVEEHKY